MSDLDILRRRNRQGVSSVSADHFVKQAGRNEQLAPTALLQQNAAEDATLIE
jgi:hypothetical protein